MSNFTIQDYKEMCEMLTRERDYEHTRFLREQIKRSELQEEIDNLKSKDIDYVDVCDYLEYDPNDKIEELEREIQQLKENKRYVRKCLIDLLGDPNEWNEPNGDDIKFRDIMEGLEQLKYQSQQYKKSDEYLAKLEEFNKKYEEAIEVNVVGLGWCRYKNSKERDENIVYCKNGVWKIKGDKTAYFDEVYCETESDEDEDSDEDVVLSGDIVDFLRMKNDTKQL